MYIGLLKLMGEFSQWKIWLFSKRMIDWEPKCVEEIEMFAAKEKRLWNL